ncbi:hypothetical protein [Nonomuraea sp. WAC 01424]|uniref:hypothetical protein n=1 Tax=Nonomuraea sp. WAC 01424 TaxID=2203200 RepID=UPI0021AD9A19|nr:hypothetical protein [Nonomuraea sp. WAC 01424]
MADGVEGLIHLPRPTGDPAGAPRPGDEITVTVTKIDTPRRLLTLSREAAR